MSLICNYLANRRLAVDIDGTLSDFTCLSRGVPQGSVLGPLLFCIFINDLPDAVKYTSTHLYVDDAQLCKFLAAFDMDTIEQQVNSDVESVCVWADANDLQLNDAKTKAIVIGNKLNNGSKLPTIKMRGAEIRCTTNVTSE